MYKKIGLLIILLISHQQLFANNKGQDPFKLLDTHQAPVKYNEELSINKTYQRKPFSLFSVYSYKYENNKPIGFLGRNLQRIIENDSSAMWEFRKYQITRVTGYMIVLWGFLSLRFGKLYFIQSDNVNINVLMSLTAIALGYGVGYRLAHYNLQKAIDAFNKHEKEKKLQKSSRSFLITYRFSF